MSVSLTLTAPSVPQWHTKTEVHFYGGQPTTYAKALRKREVKNGYKVKLKKPGPSIATVMYQIEVAKKEQVQA